MPGLKMPPPKHSETARGVVPDGAKTLISSHLAAATARAEDRIEPKAEMPGVKMPPRKHSETARGVVPDGAKMVTGSGTTTAGLLKKRFRSELEMVRGLVQKARLLVAVNGGAVEAGAKRRKTSGPLVAVEVIQPRMSRDERENLAGSLSSLSLDLPQHIVEFLQRQCSAVLYGGEMEINLHSAGDASLFQLKKLLDEFAVERKKCLEAEPKPHKDEDVAASDAMIKDEEEDELVDICGEASPVVLDKKLPETGDDSPSSSSSSSSQSGSSCGGDSSDSDSDSGESTGRSPNPADHPIEDATPAAVAVEPPELKISAVQEEKLHRAASPAAGRIGDLIAKAQEEKRRCLRELERKRAREKLQEMENTAMPSDSIHPADMAKLQIAEVEYVVSSADNMSPVQQLGLVMKE